MTISFLGAAGSKAQQNITATSPTMKVTKACPVGTEVFVAYVASNTRPGDESEGQTQLITEADALSSLTDSKDNTYELVYAMHGPYDGPICVGLWHSKLTTALNATTDNFEPVFGVGSLVPATYSFAMGAAAVSVAPGKKLAADGAGGRADGGTGTVPSLSFSGAQNVSHFILGMVGLQAPGTDGFGQDSQYVSINAPSCGVHTLRWGRRIAKVTADTWAPTLENSCDQLAFLPVWNEVAV